MDIFDHFEKRRRELEQLSASPDDLTCVAAEDGLSGRIEAKIGLTERTYLSARERIVIDEHGHPQIEKYAYYFIADGGEVWGEDKDPSHDPIVHGHIGSDHGRVPSDGVTLTQALQRAWEQTDAYPDEELDPEWKGY